MMRMLFNYDFCECTHIVFYDKSNDSIAHSS